MALGIYLGGTTGAADGTLEIPGDGVGLTLGAVGSVGTIHLRASSGNRNAEQVTVNAPTDCEVSADGTTYAATAVYATGAIEDVNVAVYVKRTAGTTALTTGGTTTPRLALITEEVIPSVPDTTAPVLAGTLVATAGNGQVTLSGPTATDAVGIAKWQYRIGTGSWVDISDSANTTMPSTVVGSLTNGTGYSFTVRALDAADNASNVSNAATATPAAPVFIDTFNRADVTPMDNGWTVFNKGDAPSWGVSGNCASVSPISAYMSTLSRTRGTAIRTRVVIGAGHASGTSEPVLWLGFSKDHYYTVGSLLAYIRAGIGETLYAGILVDGDFVGDDYGPTEITMAAGTVIDFEVDYANGHVHLYADGALVKSYSTGSIDTYANVFIGAKLSTTSGTATLKLDEFSTYSSLLG